MALFASNISYSNVSVDATYHLAYYNIIGAWVESGPEPGEPPYDQFIAVYEDAVLSQNVYCGSSGDFYSNQYEIADILDGGA